MAKNRGNDTLSAKISRTEFWTVVGSIAGVLGVIATIIFGVASGSSSSTEPSPSQASGQSKSNSATSAAPSELSSTAPSSQSSWPGSPAGISYKTGTTTLTGFTYSPGDTFDLEENKKSDNGGDERDDLSSQMTTGVSVENGAKIARWPGQQPPTLQDCIQLPVTEWDKSEVIDPDHFLTPSTYCVTSNDGRVGRIKTIGANIGHNVSSDFTFSYLLWKKSGDK